MTTEPFFQKIYQALTEPDPEQKCAKTTKLFTQYAQVDSLQNTNLSHPSQEDETAIPGCPAKPELVIPGKVKRRGLGSEKGRASFIHAITHIEFNAINLALDAVWRFRDMPAQFYCDWLKVAKEEAYHFSLLTGRLDEMGYHYGDFPAHNGLWEMAIETGHDVMVRMALVPRVLEARGLDITPFMLEKLTKIGDHTTVNLLEIILNDEIDHVRIGSHWFHHCCDQRDLDPIPTFLSLIQTHMTTPPKSPFNEEARTQAGFSDTEIQALLAMEKRWIKEIKG